MAVVKLTDTWILQNYAQVFESTKVGEAKQSPPLAALSHFAFPGLTWRLDIYPRGDSRSEPNFASFYVFAALGSEAAESVSSVWAKWALTVVAGDTAANLKEGVKLNEYLIGRCGWGCHDTFRHDALATALNKDGHLEMKLDLSVYKIVDLLNCRETVRALLSANQHAVVTVTVQGKTFKAHKAILAKRCASFIETAPVGTTADAYSAFLGAVYYDQFDFLTNWDSALGVLRLSVKFGADQVKEYCDNALAQLIPALDFPVLLGILRDAIQSNAPAMKSACVHVLAEKKDLLTSADWAKFKATESIHVFQAICDVLLEKSASGDAGAGHLKEIEESCDNGLAGLIPSLSFPVLLQILSAAILEGKIATKATCIRVLTEKKNIRNSAAWATFKATEGLHVFRAICDALLEKATQGLLVPAKADYRAPEVTLRHTWHFPHVSLLSASMPAQTSVISPPFLGHEAFPRLEWQLQFYPRGNTSDSDYKPGFASLYLKALFGRELADLKSVYAKWTATIILNDGLQVSIPDSSDYVHYTGEKEMKFFGYANAFRYEKYDEALAANKLSLAFKLDLTIASIPEILKCRDLISSLHSDQTYTDIELDVNGTNFKAHKFILAVRSAVFAQMFEADPGGIVEIKDTTPEAFKPFMAGVYYENWGFLSDLDATISVLILTERYAVADLKRYCDEALAHFANESNVAKILPLAAIHNADATKLACFGILFANGKRLKSGDWIKFKTCNKIELHVDGEIFKASKAVLSTRSDVFARMFETDMEETKNGKVPIKDTTPEAFEVFLAAVYYDSWTFLLDIDATIEVLNLAEKYGVADLKRHCDDALAKFANESNVFKILPHAALQNADATMAVCIEILFAKEDLLKSDGWIKFMKTNKGIMADMFEAAYRKDRQRRT